MTQTTITRPPTARTTVVGIALSVVSATLAASLVCLAVARIALAAGASDAFLALTPQVFIAFVAVGALGGAIGWAIIRRRVSRPRQLLTRLVPIVFVVSLVPDVLVGVTRALPGTNWVGVAALMIMHVVVAVCVVAANLRFLPVAGPSR